MQALFLEAGGGMVLQLIPWLAQALLHVPANELRAQRWLLPPHAATIVPGGEDSGDGGDGGESGGGGEGSGGGEGGGGDGGRGGRGRGGDGGDGGEGGGGEGGGGEGAGGGGEGGAGGEGGGGEGDGQSGQPEDEPEPYVASKAALPCHAQTISSLFLSDKASVPCRVVPGACDVCGPEGVAWLEVRGRAGA